jgi:hypothetical protein
LFIVLITAAMLLLLHLTRLGRIVHDNLPVFASRLMAILYGVGAALTLDEFALWLNLANVYWSRQGRESIDAVVLFGSLLAIGTWGAPLWTAILRRK